ncbi:hypothetical protein GIB67_001796 [Kingdonia uniflora]|uniref:demethylphylloquinone reductase n=1 Tax=Kingdonia uniflora TaxID=39325 RepID=A0A7J7LBQ2_9MAGN|nr:hypothetical protein GIB67_001796 [Kingdonia uniflora]
MSLGNLVSSYLIVEDDFIVIVPFNKKGRDQPQQQHSDERRVSAETSLFADLAWSEIMQDLSSLSEMPENGVVENRSLSREKRFDDVVNSILCSTTRMDGENVIDEVGCERIVQVSGLVNCLSDRVTGNCLLRTILSSDKTTLCLCPDWLKTILKAFSFLNIFYGFMQMQQEYIIWDRLKGLMEKLGRFGLEVTIADVERLLVVCSKVVRFGRKVTRPVKLGDAIVIVDSSAEGGDNFAYDVYAVRKQISSSTVVNTMNKREIAFKANLWDDIKTLRSETLAGNGTKMFSLEDFLVYKKDDNTFSKKSEVKRARRSGADAPISHSGQSRCCVGLYPSLYCLSAYDDTNPLVPMEMVEHLRKGIGSRGQIVHVEEIAARTAVHVEMPSEISETIISTLKRIGISKLYSHQAESLQASFSGKSVVVATMTSSGKSLCYNLPVLEELSHNLLSCALYLFPTKALAQDQLRSLLVSTEGLDVCLNIGVYDGDTSQEDRMWLRDNARLLITNPDMLHMSILPFHSQFQRILSNLRFIVIDEAHSYKGVFGCHAALILRRLRRICSHVYGSDPSFILCTATSGNPREHVMELAGLPTMDIVQNDGSPCGPKLFVLWNPPLYLKTVSKNSSLNTSKSADTDAVARRSSPILEISCLFAEMVQHGLRCIAFCKTRKLCELVLSYTHKILRETAPDLVDSICAYRAGYIAQDRRRIESELFGGKLRGVAATNALELGIDVGHVDATLHLGFPGSVSSLWQQAGRSGRREKPSLAVYVAFEGPLDQYFMKFPQKLFGRPIECCHIDAQNKQVLEQHLACAAFELPLSLFYDEKYFGPGLNSAIPALKNKGLLISYPSRDSLAKIWSYIGHEKKPSHAVSIRAIEAEKYKVVDKTSNEVLEEIEESKAFFQVIRVVVYEGAVYMHQGKTYLVNALDLSGKVALCQEADLKYYTKTRDYTDIHVIGGDIAYPASVGETQHSRTTAQTHTCTVTTTWFGFFRIWQGSNEIFDTVDLSLPNYSYESQAVWIRVPQSIKRKVEIQNFSFRGGLHAACHALLNVVPLYILCNSSDLTSECANPHDTRYYPERILLYDKHPGGSGISAQVQPHFRELLTAALDLLISCHCAGGTGCPNCVQTLSCHEYNEVLGKDAAIMILKGVIETEESYFGSCLDQMSSGIAQTSDGESAIPPSYTWPDDKQKPRVCILGGGFGGLYTALRLESLEWPDDRKPQVLLVDQSDRFVFKPMLYELLSGEVDAWEIAPSFSELLASTSVQFIQDRVKFLHPSNSLERSRSTGFSCSGVVDLESGMLIEYDWLVLSLGAETKFDLVPGAADFALPFSTFEDACKVDDKLKILERKKFGKDSSPIHVSVVGCGYAGVELAATVSERLKEKGVVQAINVETAICPTATPGSREAALKVLQSRNVQLYLGYYVTCVKKHGNFEDPEKLEAVEKDEDITVGKDREFILELQSTQKGLKSQILESDLVLWTVGSKPLIPSLDSRDASQMFPLNARGQAETDETLRVKGHPRIFAIGDSAALRDSNGRLLPATAQVC